MFISAADYAKGGTANKPTTPNKPTKSGFVSAADFAKNQPVTKPTLGSKVAKVGKELVKAVVSPVATMVARPVQLAATIAGATPEQINKVNLGGYVAPVPESGKDVVKDIGRGIQTVGLGLGGAGLKGLTTAKSILPVLAKESAIGAGVGFGVGLEQGGTAKDVLKSTALGGAIGAVAPVVLKGASKLLSKKAPAVVEKVAEKEASNIPTPESIGISETTPTYKPEPKNIIEVNGKKFTPPTKQYNEYLQAKKVYEYESSLQKKIIDNPNSNQSNVELANGRLKALGMKFSALKRKLTGNYTATELNNIVKKEESNYLGKKVQVKTTTGIVDGTINSGSKFGQFEIKLKGGKIIKVTADKIKDKRTSQEIVDAYTSHRKEYIPEEVVSQPKIETPPLSQAISDKVKAQKAIPEQPAITTPEKQQYDNYRKEKLDEDPQFVGGSNEAKIAKYDEIRPTKSNEEMIDYVTGKDKSVIEGLPKPAALNLLRIEAQLNPENFTGKELSRLASNYAKSEGGALLQSTQVTRKGFIDNAFDAITLANRDLQDALKKKGITKKTIINFLDDNQCTL